MKIVCIIVNYRTAKLAVSAATSTVQELMQLDTNWKLVVVDNNSDDGSLDILADGLQSLRYNLEADDEKIEFIESDHNGGYGYGNNLVLRRYLGSSEPPDYFYILNPDAQPTPGSVCSLVEFMESHRKVGIAGSRIIGPDGIPHVTAFRFPGIASEFEGAIKFGPVSKALKDYSVPLGIPEESTQVDWVAGASMILRTEMLQQIGLFDERYFLYYEETDLCLNAKKAGWTTWYIRDSEAVHIGSASTGMKNWERLPKYWLDSRRTYFVKNFGRLYYGIATIACVLGHALFWLHSSVRGKPQSEPHHVATDMTFHFFARVFEKSTFPTKA